MSKKTQQTNLEKNINIPEMAAETCLWEESIKLALIDPKFEMRKELRYETQKINSDVSQNDFCKEVKDFNLPALRKYFFSQEINSPKKAMAFNKINKLLSKEINRRGSLVELKELFPLIFPETKEQNLLIKKIALKFFKKK